MVVERELDLGKRRSSSFRLKESEIEKIISATDNLRDRLIIELLAFSGARRAEICLLRRCDVLLERGVLLMPTVKRRSSPYDNCRIIPIISDSLKRDLEYYIKITDLQFKPSGYSKLLQSNQKRNQDGLTTCRISQIVSHVCEEADVKSPNPRTKHCYCHLFRHSFVKYCRAKGVDFKAISQFCGHKTVSFTMDFYGTLDEIELKNEAKKISGYGEKKIILQSDERNE